MPRTIGVERGIVSVRRDRDAMVVAHVTVGRGTSRPDLTPAFGWSGEDRDRAAADRGRNLVLQGFNAHVERQQTGRTNPVWVGVP